MDQNNMGGMNFVTGDETVPENMEINKPLSSVINQPVGEQPQVQNNVGTTPVAPTLSSVISQPGNEQSQTLAQQPVQETAPMLPNEINQSVGGQTRVQNNMETTQVAPTLSSVINQPVAEQPQIQNNMELPPQNSVVNSGTTGVTNSENAGDVKQNKLKKILIVVVVILALTAVGIVLGFVLFDKFGSKEETPVEDSAVVNDTLLQANVINNVNVDEDDLSSVLSLLGISTLANGTNVNALTYYVTDENYRDNAKEIITYYSILGSDMTSSFDINDYKDDKGACADTEGCAIISREDAEKILKLYDFEGKIDDYFYKSASSGDVYGIHYDGTLDLPQFNGNNLGISHDLIARYIGDDDIDVEDTQVFNYNDDSGQVKTVNRVVKYTFKKNGDGEYHLDSVLINE